MPCGTSRWPVVTAQTPQVGSFTISDDTRPPSTERPPGTRVRVPLPAVSTSGPWTDRIVREPPGRSTMTSTSELIAEIEQVGEAYASFVQTLSEQQFRQRPDPNEWTVAEITGHVSEAPLTFANHARVLAEQGGGPAGRPPEDPGRLAAVARL